MAPSAAIGLMDDIADQIDVATAQLKSLDGNDVEYAARRAVLEEHLATLKEQHQDAQFTALGSPRGSGRDGPHDDPRTSLPIIRSQRPQTSDGTPRQVGGRPMTSTEVDPPIFGGHFASDGVLAAQHQPPPWNGNRDHVHKNNTMPATERPSIHGRDTSTSASSPESGFLRPQKRQRESIGLLSNQPGHPYKSMRTTPSPAMTATTSPTSASSFEFPDDPDLLALLGGNPAQDLRDMREEQKEQERALEAKRQQEREDEAFARQLFEQDSGLPSATSEDFSRPGSSAIPGYTSQTTLDNQGSYRRPTFDTFPSPFAPKSEDPFLNSSRSVKQETPHYSSHKPTNNEGSFRDFIDLENDAYLVQQPDSAGPHLSSDPVEIDASAFGASNGSGVGRPPVVDACDASDHSISAGPSGWAGQFGKSLANTGNSILNGASNWLDHRLDNYSNGMSGIGGTSVYGYNEHNAPNGTVDVDGFPSFGYSPQFNPQNIFDRHGINPQDPANSDLMDSYRDRVDYLSNDPTRTAEEIKTLLENIRPDEELPPENREGTPDAMKYPLMEHQKLGLTWMKSMEDGSNKGGILADEMGLGKTIQALALLIAHRSTDPLCKTTLIVCPVALLKQWDQEIKSKLKDNHRLKVHTLHAEKRHTTWAALQGYDVVLTTFGMLGTEMKRREHIEMNKRANPNWRPTGRNDYLRLLGDECKWYRVIIDEAQCIKNKNTKSAIGASLLQAKTRFCMTGTPMMNNVQELYSLIHFLRIKPYNESHKFNNDFTRPLKGNSPALKAKAMRQLQALLKAILLRRTKKSQIDGKPILNLPERTTEACHAAFSEDEAAFYSALQSRTQLQFNKYLKAGTVGRNYSNILVLLLRLRQACCHPHLIKDFGQASGAVDASPDEMRKLAKELAEDVVTRITELSRQNEDGLECPICMDAAENATIFIPCGHNTCSECFARITDPSQAIADGNADGHAEAKCPNCRGKITPSKVIDHKIFKQVFMPELAGNENSIEDPEADVDTTDGSDDEDTTDDDGDDEGVDSKGNLKDFVVDDDVATEDDSDTEDGDDEGYRAGKTPFEKSAKKKAKKGKGKGKGKGKEPKAPRKTLAQLKKEGMRNAKARKRYLKRLNKDWVPSAKTDNVMELLRAIQETKDPETKQCEKTIIFSQFTSLLDLLEVPMTQEHWTYSRYDGSMSAGARNDAVTDFTEKKDCKIMLVSLKAGNAGLNLVAASQVIILDPFWNPFIEEQAIDRAHRIGQQKPVKVHRILVPNTVEDRILALQDKKRELIESALDEKASQNVGRLGIRELGFLFDVPT